MKAIGTRQKKFASVFRGVLVQNIQKIVPQSFQSIESVFSIGDVIMSPDLRHAKVEVLCKQECLAGHLSTLEKFLPLLRKKSAMLLHTKYMPTIRFIGRPQIDFLS
jgi:ribosome-binding factor A